MDRGVCARGPFPESRADEEQPMGGEGQVCASIKE